MKTAVITLRSIKEPDGWGELASDLGLTDAQKDIFFEFGEYADLELVFNEKLQVVSGRILPSAHRTKK